MLLKWGEDRTEVRHGVVFLYINIMFSHERLKV